MLKFSSGDTIEFRRGYSKNAKTIKKTIKHIRILSLETLLKEDEEAFNFLCQKERVYFYAIRFK